MGVVKTFHFEDGCTAYIDDRYCETPEKSAEIIRDLSNWLVRLINDKLRSGALTKEDFDRAGIQLGSYEKFMEWKEGRST